MPKVLIGGKSVEMSLDEIRKRGVLGGAEWDRERDNVQSWKTHEQMSRDMDLDGHIFSQRVGARNRTSTEPPVIEHVEPGSEVTFDQLFEDQEYWS